MENRYLFVYGTLREDAGHEMYHVLARHAVFVGTATVRGELYSLGDYPGLVPRHDATDLIKGEVYEIRNDALERTLSVLDDYEGLGPEDPLPHEYRRELVHITLDDGRQLEAWAYVVNRSLEGLGRIRSGDFSQNGASRGRRNGARTRRRWDVPAAWTVAVGQFLTASDRSSTLAGAAWEDSHGG